MKRTLMLVGALLGAALSGYAAPASAGTENGGDGISSTVPAVQAPSIAKKSVQRAGLLVRIIPTSSVARSSPNYAVNKHIIMRGLRGEFVGMNRTDNPAAWHKIGYLEWSDMVVATGFNLWRGQPNPSGAFAGEFGNLLRFPVTAVSTNGVPFAARQGEIEIQSSFVPLNFRGNIGINSSTGAEIPYQYILQGWSYGGDRAPDTGDDAKYESDTSPVSSSVLVHQLRSFGATSSFAAAKVADIGADRNATTAPGFFVSFRVTFRDADGTVLGSDAVLLTTAPRLNVRLVEKDKYALDVIGQPGGFGYQILYGFLPKEIWTPVPVTYGAGGSFTNELRHHSVAFFRLRQTAAP
ncbi:MAG: hypothetical protein HYW65_01405 [Candidatus Liptonbacteria bacterium]|nr:hypothetical protein [Candidatus Liptonbacteria bacterium]